MLSENIRNFRKAKGLSQEELAAKLNVVRQTVSKGNRFIRAGRRAFSGLVRGVRNAGGRFAWRNGGASASRRHPNDRRKA